MALLKPILALLIFGNAAAWARTALIDVKTCVAPLSPELFNDFKTESETRQQLGSAGSFISADVAHVKKMIDIRGSDEHRLAESILNHLQIMPETQHPRMFEVIKVAIRVARERKASLSVTAWEIPEDVMMDADDAASKVIRVSLDMIGDGIKETSIVRLPNLAIRNGSAAKRIDIDISPKRLSVAGGETQAITGFGKVIVGDEVSHGPALVIQDSDPIHPAITSQGSEPERFVGSQAKSLYRDVTAIAYEVTRSLFSQAANISFRSESGIHAVNNGSGWQSIH